MSQCIKESPVGLECSGGPGVLFFPLINVKMPTTVGILKFMSRKNFMLGWVEHERGFITSRPGL